MSESEMYPVIKTIKPEELDSVLEELERNGATDLALLGPIVVILFHKPEVLKKKFEKYNNIYHLVVKNNGVPLFCNSASLSKLKSLLIWGIPLHNSDIDWLAGLTDCTKLELFLNFFTAGKGEIARLTNLTSLDIRGNNITDNGVKEIASLTKLTSLNISSNQITDEGVKEIASLTNLSSLNISSNQITDEGVKEIASLTNLSSLNISNNKITGAGVKEIASLTNLSSLNISNNKITGAGVKEIAKLTKLASLDISNNQIINESIKEIARLTNLTSLGLNRNQITDEGAKLIATLTNLTSLHISGNQITGERVNEIASLTNLTMLDIGRNQITDEGAKLIARLTNLTSLDISDNKITDEGAKLIARLTNLTSLGLNRNQITDEGAKLIARLTNLISLGLNRNQITDEGTKSLACLDNLINLGLQETRITDLSPFLSLKRLRRLNISKTQVTDLTPLKKFLFKGCEVNWSTWGNGILVEDCPLVTPSPEIVKQGHQAVLNYFRELESQGVDKLYEAKLLFVGEGGAGKTSLLRRLYQTDLPLPKEDETTKGIDIIRHTFLFPDNRTFNLNIWDFGGQQIYHTTHQFFLTKRSLYVLLDDTKKDHKNAQDEGFKYWLDAVEVLTDASPVLIFQNEKGGRSKQIDETGIKRRYSNVKEVFRGDLNNTNDADSIRDAIKYHVQKLEHIGNEVPKKWISIRKDIEKKAREIPYITCKDYFSMYDKHLPSNKEKALHLSRYFHDLGVFLHFQDDICLKNTVILQNHWATEAVFRIIDDEIVRRDKQGRFDIADCERIWASPEYEEMHPELLALMEKFELCYPLADTKPETWLVPQLLSPSMPDPLKDWAKQGDMCLIYRYDFLPRGMINRLMVRMNRFVRQPQMAWSNGVLFEKETTTLLASVSCNGNEIRLFSRGPESKALLSVIASDLDAMNQNIQGLTNRLSKWIPCICAECRTSNEPYLFEEKSLLKRKEKNVFEVECDHSYEKVNVLEILEGLKLNVLPSWAEETKPKPIDYDEDGECNGIDTAKLVKKEKTIQIFLASSEELREDRDAFDLYFRQQNDELRKRGLYLKIIRWENFLDAMSETRKQDDYNKKVRECDIFLCLFKTKTGKFTEEEFDIAHQTFKATKKPKIYTFFKKTEISTSSKNKDALISLWKFQQKLSDLGHFYTEYDTIADLKLQFKDQLEMLINEGSLDS